MALPSKKSVANLKQDDDTYERLKPRSRERLYPSIEDFNFDFSTLNRRNSAPGRMTLKSAFHANNSMTSRTTMTSQSQSQKEHHSTFHTKCKDLFSVSSSHSKITTESDHPVTPKRCSVSSIQTLPSDCSAEDLSAIQAALYPEDKNEEELKSMELVRQLMREELGLVPPQDESSSSDASSPMASSEELPPAEGGQGPVHASPKPAAKETSKTSSAITQDLVYQICCKLDEINVDVRTEQWQMLAPHEIEKLEVITYDKSTSCCTDEDSSCLICQQEYEHKDVLRKMRCGHSFHCACVDPWLLKHDFCPVCRKTIDEE